MRQWPWSSYRAYAGYVAAPHWLCRQTLGRLCGGRTLREQQGAVRHDTEQAVRQGLPERPWERLIGRTVLGSAAFLRGLGAKVKEPGREHAGADEVRTAVSWEAITRAVEREKGEPWQAFANRHGDWGRDAALWLGRRAGRLSLRELGERAQGLDYAAVAVAVRRFPGRLAHDAALAKIVRALERQLSNV